MKASHVFYLLLLSLIISSCDECKWLGPENEDIEVGKILWTHELTDEGVNILCQTLGGDLGCRMAQGTEGNIYYSAGGTSLTWKPTRIYCINKEDGSLKWRSEEMDNSYMKSHIMVGNDGTVYAIGNEKLYAFDPGSGSTKWVWSAPEKIGNIYTGGPLASMSLMSDGTLLVSSQVTGGLYNINTNKELIWYQIGPKSYPYELSIGPDGNIYSLNYMYAPDYDGSLFLVSRDQNTGNIRWLIKTDAGIGGGNNIAFDLDGNVLASFRAIGESMIKIHKIDASSGNIFWSSTFESNAHGLYVGPEGFAYQLLNPPGELFGTYRINLTTSEMQYINSNLGFGAIDSKTRLIYDFIDTEDNAEKLGAFFMDGVLDWKTEAVVIDDRTFLISDDHIIYALGNSNTIMAIQSDAALASSGWPRLGHDNRNTFNVGLH